MNEFFLGEGFVLDVGRLRADYAHWRDRIGEPYRLAYPVQNSNSAAQGMLGVPGWGAGIPGIPDMPAGGLGAGRSALVTSLSGFVWNW